MSDCEGSYWYVLAPFVEKTRCMGSQITGAFPVTNKQLTVDSLPFCSDMVLCYNSIGEAVALLG